jgi:hypothetical protein
MPGHKGRRVFWQKCRNFQNWISGISFPGEFGGLAVKTLFASRLRVFVVK